MRELILYYIILFYELLFAYQKKQPRCETIGKSTKGTTIEAIDLSSEQLLENVRELMYQLSPVLFYLASSNSGAYFSRICRLTSDLCSSSELFNLWRNRLKDSQSLTETENNWLICSSVAVTTL